MFKFWKKIKGYFCCIGEEKSEKKVDIPIETKPIKEPQIMINSCCEVCNNCYIKMTGRNPCDILKTFISTPEDSKYWYTKAMNYKDNSEKDAAFLHFLEFHLVGNNDRQLFHKWLLRLKESKSSWEDWENLITKTKRLEDYFIDEPKIIIHGELSKRLSSNLTENVENNDNDVEFEILEHN